MSSNEETRMSSSNDPSTPDVPQRASERSEDFRRELEHLINRHSQESMGGNTPDFILADTDSPGC